MDDDGSVLEGADVLVTGRRIAAVGPALAVPPGTVEIDARGGIVMPGMIDTHRHLWQTAMRGYGADWTLSQYFDWYYVQHGARFRPEDVYAGNLLGAVEALDEGVTTTVDWSHGLRTPDHAEAAVDALEEVPGRFVLAYGNIFDAPWTWSRTAGLHDLVSRRLRRSDLLGFQMAFDVTGDPQFPERAAFEVARDLDAAVTTHAGVRGATDDAAVRLMHEHGFMEERTVYVHAATLGEESYRLIAETGGSVSVASEAESSGGQGYPPTWRLRAHGIPVSLSTDSSVWGSADMFSAVRATLAADRAREHLEAHARDETVTDVGLRAQQAVWWATRGGARALGLDDVTGSLEPGKKADVVLLKNDASPVMAPVLHPWGHVALQAQRGDVRTVLVDGRVVKHDHRLLGDHVARARAAAEATVEHLRREVGEEAWSAGRVPGSGTGGFDSPYTYSDHRGAAAAAPPR
ncbi:amidohydrolase [Xylanimonas oleitrophica]|uniref:Amidohydrolase n=2 Tax=Xylanimonas oleitrophica TaxID=2607479 RepID=A0A2W5XVE0_9MICO|nr:amidohydrolase [Xylanimonas oleitrophica]